ncbi:duf895 domain membrane [Lecanosticta acicola]|uniref:Duf895 domain membrane n=1 Tax=Lecanosticta acicola TaxID=111012 RepID=A0AAI8Z7L4_9PEZI|nr:duf895 domain membrane [Lecanosticta acicola]
MSNRSTFYQSLHDFYRGTICQAIILGLISFTQPGIWTAMNNLGAGGQAKPYVVNAVNVITFAVMFVFSPLASIIGNIIGMRWVLIFGCLGYVPYSAALYCNSMWGTQWFLIFGGVTCGFSAAALWPAEATIAVGYPEVRRRGLCIAIWLALSKLGSIIGTAIQLAINKDGDTTGAIAPRTYLVLVAIQCLGLPLSFLISPPEKLVRKDGKKPVFANRNGGFKSQLLLFLAQLKRKEVVLLIPAFVSAQWGSAYYGNWLTEYYSVRARTLSGFVVAVVGAIVNILSGWLLDTKLIRRSTQAKSTWYSLLALFTAIWIWNLILQARWDSSPPGDIDWNSRLFSQGMALYVLFRIAYEVIGVWLYWALGTFDSEVDTISLSMGVLRSCESLGQACAYGVGASKASLMTNLIVTVVVFFISAPATSWASHLINDRLNGEDSDSDDLSLPDSGSATPASEVQQISLTANDKVDIKEA